MPMRPNDSKLISYALIGYGLMNLVGGSLRFGGLRIYWADFLFLRNPEALVEFTRYVESVVAVSAGILLLRRPARAFSLVLVLTIISTCKMIFAIREGVLQAQRVGRPIDQAAYGAFISWFALPVMGLVTLLVIRRSPTEASVPRCGSCGYDLRGLIEPRCPECGRVYTLDEFHEL
jgi:hypothetical protein